MRRHKVFKVNHVHLLVIAVATGAVARLLDGGERGPVGTLMRAKSSFPCGSRMIMARFKERFEMKGNGWAESKASGVRARNTSSIKNVRSAFFLFSVRLFVGMDEDPGTGKAGGSPLSSSRILVGKFREEDFFYRKGCSDAVIPKSGGALSTWAA